MSGLEIRAEQLDNLVRGMMSEKENGEYEYKIRELAEEVSANLNLTRDFLMLVMHPYEDSREKAKATFDINKLLQLYFDTQTQLYILADRLMEAEDKAKQLTELLYTKTATK